ncbi:hypothetical protein [Nocardiopsis protaetiae]|uniref:hypothetical protein n=1 Tax=Nocardiopsis protaetiae TaxID=3382270 RepID=UPI00387AB6F7
MKLTKLSAGDASALAVATLDLDADAVGLSSVEGIAASLRRAASFMCPTSPSRLVDAVLGALRPLHSDELKRDDLMDLLDQLVTSGDLLELRHGNSHSTRLLYLAPPSYIERIPGTYLLMGVRPFGAPFISDGLAQMIEHEGHTRLLRVSPMTAETELRSRGLLPVSKDHWVARPRVESPSDFLARYRARLDVAAEAGQLDGLMLLDPTQKPRFYKGRWRPPADGDTGDFVARRPQAYGADLWCLIRFETGIAQRLIEFPVDDPVVPGRDEAWRYQAAVDAVCGTPQSFRLPPNDSPGDEVTLDFFSPLPSFAERYLKIVGPTLGKTPGALFSFQLPTSAVTDVTRFLTDMLWMINEEDSSGD